MKTAKTPMMALTHTPRRSGRPDLSLTAATLACLSMAACQPLHEGLRGGLLEPWLSAGASAPDLNPLQSVFEPDGEGDLSERDARDTDPDEAPAGPWSDHTGRAAEEGANHDAPPRRAEYVLMGVDCFGAEEGACDLFSRLAGLDEGQRLKLGWTGDGAAGRIQQSGAFALVNLSPVFYPDGSAYVTIDVVPSLQRERLKLRPAPDLDVTINSNLLEIHDKFNAAWMSLFAQGVDVSSTSRAGYWHYSHDTLVPFVKLFRAEVPGQRQELIQVMLYDAHPERRQAAASLLGFDREDALSAEALTWALLDPAPVVRSAAARALLPKVRHAVGRHDDTPPISAVPVIHMLSLPSTSDRSGASALLADLALLPSLRGQILSATFPILLQMIEATAPGSRGSAVEVLQAATGLSYGAEPERWKQVKIQ